MTDLLEARGARCRGQGTSAEGTMEIEGGADLVVGADGRGSVVRDRAGLALRELGAPIDVLWFRLARDHGDPSETMGRFAAGHIFIMIDRGDYWQCGCVIAKGSFDRLRQRGIEGVPFGDRDRSTVRSRDKVAALAVTGTRSSSLPCASTRSTAFGTSRDCWSSAMRRTPCRRSAASASTLRSRMRWRQPTSLQGR